MAELRIERDLKRGDRPRAARLRKRALASGEVIAREYDDDGARVAWSHDTVPEAQAYANALAELGFVPNGYVKATEPSPQPIVLPAPVVEILDASQELRTVVRIVAPPGVTLPAGVRVHRYSDAPDSGQRPDLYWDEDDDDRDDPVYFSYNLGEPFTVRWQTGGSHTLRGSLFLPGGQDGPWCAPVSVTVKGATTPAPQPRPTALGPVLDFERPVTDYGGVQLGRVTREVDQVTGPYLKLVADAKASDGNWRAHLHSKLPCQHGLKAWWAGRVRVPAANGSGARWWSLCSWFGPPWNGPAPMQLYVSDAKLQIHARSPVYTPLPRDPWLDFIIGLRFSNVADGWFEPYVRHGDSWEQVAPRRTEQTLPSGMTSGYLLVNSYADGGQGQGPFTTHHDEHALYATLDEAKRA